MIEAATASVMTAQVARGNIEPAAASARSMSASPVKVQKAAVNNAPYLSPYVRLSPGVKPVLVVRDADTGSQVTQYPTPAQIQAYQSAQAAQARLAAAQPSQPITGSDTNSAPEVKQVSYEAAKAVLQNSVQYQEIKKEAMAQSAKAEAYQPPVPQAEPQRVSTEA